jgi:hypothetical protein
MSRHAVSIDGNHALTNHYNPGGIPAHHCACDQALDAVTPGYQARFQALDAVTPGYQARFQATTSLHALVSQYHALHTLK